MAHIPSATPDFVLPSDSRSWLAVAGLAVVIFSYLSLISTAPIDDAFITMRYAKTLLSSGTWGFYPGHISNTATSPLNVLLLTLVSVVTRSPLTAVLWLTTAELVALALFLRGIGKLLGLEWFAGIAFIGLICNPLLMSTLGLESILFVTLLVAALYFYLAKRFEVMAIACGLLTLTRPDGILFFAICLVAMPSNLRSRVRVLIVYALCLTPWYLFAWIELGSVVPDTLLIKVNHSWGRYTFRNGLILYLRRFPLETGLSFLFVPLATLTLWRPVRQIGACVYLLMGYGALYYTAYSLLGVPPFHWYYVPLVLDVVLLGALAIAQLAHTAIGASWRDLGPLPVAALAIPVIGVAVLFVREGVPLREAWIHTNWATHSQYRNIGEWLRDHDAGETGLSDGEIGTVAYYCNCLLRDEFSERRWLDNRVEMSIADTGLRGLMNRINYWFYEPQVPFDDSAFMVTYLQMFSERITTGQRWQVGTRWKPNGVIFYNRFHRHR